MSSWETSPLDAALNPDGVENPEEQEPTINVDGAHVPLSMAAEAVRRCTEVIAFTNKLLAHDKLSLVEPDDERNLIDKAEVRQWVTSIRDRCIPDQD